MTDDAPVTELIEAVSAYRGELLPGFYDEWAMLERERLQAIFERKMSLLLERLTTEQRWPDILEWGKRWIALGHVPEPADQVKALMADGQKATALTGTEGKTLAWFSGFAPFDDSRYAVVVLLEDEDVEGESRSGRSCSRARRASPPKMRCGKASSRHLPAAATPA